MVFYCPRCGKCFTSSDVGIDIENCALGEIDGINNGIYHKKCDCGNYLAGYVDIKPENLFLIDFARSLIAKFNKGGSGYSWRYKRHIKNVIKNKPKKEYRKVGF